MSSDGRKAVVVLDSDIWSFELGRESLTRLTTDPAEDYMPVWSPDDGRVIFSSNREGSSVLSFYERKADGTGPVEWIARGSEYLRAFGWSPDGSCLMFDYGQGVNGDIGTLCGPGVESSWRPLLVTEAREGAPAVSPDGEWLAYQADDTGRFEIYVERFPDLGGRQRVSTAGGMHAHWSADGGELYYAEEGRRMMSVPVRLGGEADFSPGNPSVLFEGDYLFTFDVHPGDGRFLLLKQHSADPDSGVELVLVQNWFQELNRLAPTR